jgi:hypothetical protein
MNCKTGIILNTAAIEVNDFPNFACGHRSPASMCRRRMKRNLGRDIMPPAARCCRESEAL